ncbi:MAG: tRNA pseudouridine(38-40) synthase TruA [Candidatus Omnitrophota bacterium]|nr:MAG: tRNA pseudouridine(38-40) synthase TruA [Candidatus Omnitrophota bacterium]
MREKNVKLILSFDGSGFYGWQRQKDKISIQETIENAGLKIFGKEIKIKGCGRTDSKVHGLSYVANFKIETDLKEEEIKGAFNSNLPPSIRIKKVEIEKDDFHSRYSAKSKVYRYLITQSPSPFLQRYAYYVKEKIDIKRMEIASKYIIGKHDFTSFCASGSSVKDKVREVKRIEIKEENFTIDPEIKILIIEIEADGFLYKMARNIVGTLIEVGKGKIEPEDVKKIIEAKDRKIAPPTPPPHGLYLKQVKY